MENTQHYGLKKPGDNDNYSIHDQNENMDIIDGALKANADAAAAAAGAQATADAAQSTAEAAQATANNHASRHAADGPDPIPYATETEGGLMSAEDKQTLDEMPRTVISDRAPGPNDDGDVWLMYEDGDKAFYVDEVNGSDLNDGLTSETAFATMEKAIQMIPDRAEMNYEIIIVGNYSQEILLGGKNLVARNTLIIRGETGDPDEHVLSGPVRILSCNADIDFAGTIGIVLRQFTTTSNIQIGGSNGVHILECKPHRNTEGSAVTFRSSIGVIENCDFGNEIVQDCIAARNAQVFSSNNSGRGARYGLRSLQASTIGKLGTQPTGGVADEFADSGGVIR